MRDDAVAIQATNEADAPQKPPAKVRLLRLENLDRRTGAYRQVAETIDRVEEDLGGPDSLSAAQRQLVRHAVLSGAMADDLATRWLAGEPVDPAAFCTLVNAESWHGRRHPEIITTVDSFRAAHG
jgi:hypothetical protein